MSNYKEANVLLTMAVVLILFTVFFVQSAVAVNIDKKVIDTDIAEGIASGFESAVAVEDSISDAAEAAVDAERASNKKFKRQISGITEKIVVELSAMKYEGHGVIELFAAAVHGVRISADDMELALIEKGIRNAVEVIVKQTDSLPTDEELEDHQCTGNRPESHLFCVLSSVVNHEIEEVKSSRKHTAPVLDIIKNIISKPPVGDTDPASPI